MKGLIRKARHVLGDPVLRRWLARRIVGLEKSPQAFVAGQPPYLGTPMNVSTPSDFRVENLPASIIDPPQSPIKIALPGKTVEVSPQNPAALFTQPYDDLETLLAAHRFAWVPIAGPTVDPNWVAALWQAWADDFGDERSGWPWHAYTAAERAINIIDFSRHFGLPGDRSETARILVCHAEIIRSNLEYFGDHYTSNHLSNNGRGLLRIGTALGRADHAETGAQIMVAEAGRIFGRSGVLREGSTHYHLLVTRNYIDAWLDAKSAGLEQAATLCDIAEKAMAAIPGLCLSGGLPLIGDISPDVPPDYLARLIGDWVGDGYADQNVWPANLLEDRRQEALSLIAGSTAVSPDKLAEDGWHRYGGHGWQALAFVSPDGWPPMPGHGHQDLGSFELHDGATKVIVDPGRGTYADSEYEGATVHNCVTIGGVGPVPVNRAYYSPGFREHIVTARPAVQRTRGGAVLREAGFQHLSGFGGVERELEFATDCVQITDRIPGSGRQKICRRFCTPHPVARDGDTAIIDAGAKSYRLSPGAGFTLIDITCWSAYGEGVPGTLIESEHRRALPSETVATIERI
jgi:hypothetical protein